MDLGGSLHQVRDRTFHCQTRRKKVSTIRVEREETVVNDNRDSFGRLVFLGTIIQHDPDKATGAYYSLRRIGIVVTMVNLISVCNPKCSIVLSMEQQESARDV